MFKAKGRLIYDPVVQRADFNSRKKMSWGCNLTAPNSIAQYYQYWVRKELGVNLNTPLYNSHVTVTKYERPPNEAVWRKHEGEIIEFEYDPEVKNSDIYFWLTVKCPRLEEIRVELGMTPQPRCAYHLTIGNLKNVSPIKTKPVPFKVFPWEQ